MTLYRTEPTVNEVSQVQDWFYQVSYWMVLHTDSESVRTALHTVQKALETLEVDARARDKAALFGNGRAR